MNRICHKLHDFWFEKAPPERLALLRFLVGAYALWYLVPRQHLFLKIAHTDPSLFAPVGVVFGSPVGPELFRWLFLATLATGVCFTLGLGLRITGPLFAGLLLWVLCYRNSWSMIYHSDNLLVFHVFVLGVARSADALSVDALLRLRLRAPAALSASPGAIAPRVPSWQYGWPVKLMCALTVCAYFVTAVAKLSGPLGLSWMSGQALRSQMAVDAMRKELLGEPSNPVAYALYDWLPLFTLLGAGSLALELLAPLALLHRRAGWFWSINTFLMHWGILLVMGISFRYQLAGVLFASFFPIERILLRRPKPVPSATLFYDGECGLCNRFVQFVLRHDARGYFRFAALQSDAGREQMSRLGLPQTDLQTVVLVEDGKSFLRSTATLRVCRRLAGLWPLLYALIIAPKPWRDWAYALVAQNRKRWFKGPSACPIMAPELSRRFIG